MTFESLLVKELQKQQRRAEFCDVVLHTQGVSVPVHSCVLSAFSPWLCGALSVMPSPEKQKRLIEVQAVEACTLLSLVTLLYSGQLNEEKEEVLSAACKLGITIPQQDITTIVSQAGTQTEYMKESVERECQTEVHYTSTLSLLSECPHPKETVETVNLIGLSSWRSDQGLDQYATATADITLTTLQNVQGIPEKLSSFQVMDVVPETSLCPTVSAPACAPQGYICPPECSTAALPPHPYPPYSTSQGQSALCDLSRCEEYDLAGLEQFENNIPGFINYFLHANSTQAVEQRGQSQKGSRGDIITAGKTKRAQRGRTQRNCAVKWERGSIRKMEQNAHRFGRVAKSAWIGQGGGRVGRMLDTRHVLKHQGRFNRRQGRGTIYKVEGEKGRSSSRGRPRKRQAESRASSVEPVCQDQAPPTKRPRGRPRKHPLPPPNAARSGMSAPAEKATNPPAPSLMHTAALPTANQPLDWLIDDVIAQLPFMPPITSSIQNNQTSVKVTDLCVVQSQPEGELTDILDSFLRTFDQHVGSCDSDVLQTWPKGQRERLNSYSKPTFGTVGSPSEYNSRGSDAMGCRTEADPAVPLEKPRDTQCITDTSEDDVDVVEVSSTLSESSNVLPLIADIVISTEEDDTEEEEIDILDYT